RNREEFWEAIFKRYCSWGKYQLEENEKTKTKCLKVAFRLHDARTFSWLSKIVTNGTSEKCATDFVNPEVKSKVTYHWDAYVYIESPYEFGKKPHNADDKWFSKRSIKECMRDPSSCYFDLDIFIDNSIQERCPICKDKKEVTSHLYLCREI